MFTRSESRRHRIAERAREVADRGAKGVAEVEKRAREVASDAEAVMRDSARRVRQTSGDAYGDLVDVVQEHPVATIVIALAAGALLASMLRR